MPRLKLGPGLVGPLLAALAAFTPNPKFVAAQSATHDAPEAPPQQRAARSGIEAPPQQPLAPGAVVWLPSPAALMVRLPAGTFSMGSTELQVLEAGRLCRGEPLGRSCELELFLNEVPAHRQKVAAFWLDRTEVTVAAYARCVALRVCRPAAYAGGALRFAKPNYPVSLVSWHDAATYCAFRGARLPSEIEFEYAARGEPGRQYPWGNSYQRRAANHGRLGLFAGDDRDGFPELAPVGSFPSGQTPQGILDLSGNVAEWVQDPLTPYGAEAPDQSSKTDRVIRGGHYAQARTWLRGAARAAAPAETRVPYIGFRCAKSAR